MNQCQNLLKKKILAKTIKLIHYKYFDTKPFSMSRTN